MDQEAWREKMLALRARKEESEDLEKEEVSPPELMSPNGFELMSCAGALLKLSHCMVERFNRFDTKKIILRGFWPPICEMESINSVPPEFVDGCEIFSVSKNMIERINGLRIFNDLKVLSLAQNQIKSLSGLECLSSSLEELIIPWNMISDISMLPLMKKLKYLDISFNHIREFTEYSKLKRCPSLIHLIFKGNPVCSDYSDEVWRDISVRKLPQLHTLDDCKIRKNIPRIKKKTKRTRK